MDIQALVRTAQSNASDAREALQAFHAGVQQPDMALVVFFCSSHYDLDALADEVRRLFTDVMVVGCTTAGEIGPGGYCDFSLSGASFPAASFTAVSGLFEDLQQFDIAKGQVFTNDLLQRMEAKAPNSSAKTPSPSC